MDAAVLPIALIIVSVVAIVVLADGFARRRTLQRRLARTHREIPRDAATGLLDRRACLPRLAAELKRAARGDGSVWVSVITIADGDADRFGRLLHDSVRIPEVAFRLADRVVCVARPDLDDAQREELLGRIVAAGPREVLTIGETVWRRGVAAQDAADVLRAATEAMRTDVNSGIQADHRHRSRS